MVEEVVNSSSERIKKCITEFIFKDSYWGYLFSKINRKQDVTLPAPMGVEPEIDGTISLIYNPTIINKMDDEFLSIVIEHEGLHILNDHIPRLLKIISDEVNKEVKNKKSYKYNISSDCAVNTLIKNMKEQYMIGNQKIEPVFPKKYGLDDRKSSEYYYVKIPDDKIEEQKSISLKGISIDGDLNSNCCNGSEIDDHNKWIENVSKVSDIGSLARRVEQYTRVVAQESYESVRRKGSLPGYISESINNLLSQPKVPYYQIIEKLVKGSRLSKYKRAYTRINKKRVYSFFINNDNLPTISPFPGKKKDFSFNISVVLDTSGSMSNKDILEGLSGIKSIIENDKDCKTTVIEADTIIQKEYEVKKIKDIEFDIKGRGGTELFPALYRCRELNTDVTLVFTDGYTDNINSKPRKLLPKRIIYVLTHGGSIDQIDKTGFIVRLNER